ncbi:PucR family transcriptional regulator ligand-binding domain-containing protein [Enterococcus pseudoavium]|uniref:PucR family transcriptional regulator ligand-binding domain-containing protein n=1 Tax=Enterococcus pseudoavium TaxID=44007 RepID=A0ABU3FI06_9ENTE|nr:PucR family transcriptional regulator ligand-binding domain-containing protein [Enterococcus pseudoavium]MDT2770704.1 PucR family transcriptional regulator ligand-binding domain-containing protein [Enterococcus pseudoavium]
MGAKLKEVLTLPSLREAQLMSGQNCLNQTVTSLTFLDISNPDDFAVLLEKNDYHSGELVLTSFFNIKDDVAKQCETICQLHKMGEMGIILYYVGTIVPKLSPEVIKMAEELDFAIIQMPKNQSLRYSEVIVDVMAYILKERTTKNIVNEILEKASLLPEQLRTVEVTLKLLSDLLRSNVLLTNAENEVINQVKWPRNSSTDLAHLLRRVVVEDGQQIQKKDFAIFYKELYHKENGVLHFYLLKELELLTEVECLQSVELLQVALNLWGKKPGEVSEQALIQAILNDESEKMYRLANQLKIDVKGIELMWLLQLNDLRAEKKLKNDILTYVANFYQTCVVQLMDDQLIVLLGDYYGTDSELDLAEAFLQTSPEQEMIDSLVACPRLRNTTDVRNTYQLVNQLAWQLPKLFHGKKTFSISEIRQVAHASKIVQAGEAEVEETLNVLAPIMDNKEQLLTLCSFLLDAGADFQVCSEQLFIHKNTVKYRIKKISEALGYNVMRFSESYECYVACLTYRLIGL